MQAYPTSVYIFRFHAVPSVIPFHNVWNGFSVRVQVPQSPTEFTEGHSLVVIMHERDPALIVSVRVFLVHWQILLFGSQNLHVFLGVFIQVVQVVGEVFDSLEVPGVDDASRRNVVLEKKREIKKKGDGISQVCVL